MIPTPTPLPINTNLKYFGNKNQLLSQTKVEDDIKMEFTNYQDVYFNRRRVFRGLSMTGGTEFYAINKSKNLVDPLIELAPGVGDTDNNLYRADSVYKIRGPNVGDNHSGSIYMINPALNFSSGNKFSVDSIPKINNIAYRIKASTANNSREYQRNSEILESSNLEIIAGSRKIKKVLNSSKLNLVTSGASVVEVYKSPQGTNYSGPPVDVYHIDKINLSNPPKFSISGSGVIYFFASSPISGSLKITNSEGISKNINYGFDYFCDVAVHDGDLIEFNTAHNDEGYIHFYHYSSMILQLYDKSICSILPFGTAAGTGTFYGGDSIVYELVSGDGSNDNSKFSIVYSGITLVGSAYLVWNENSTGIANGSELSVRVRAKGKNYNTILAENSIKFTVVSESDKLLRLPENLHSTIQDKLIICRGTDYINWTMYYGGVNDDFAIVFPGSISGLFGSFISKYKQINIKENLNVVYEFKIIGETDWKIIMILPMPGISKTLISLNIDYFYDKNKFNIFYDSFTIPSCKNVQFRCYVCDGVPDNLGPLGMGPYVYSDIINFPSRFEVDCNSSTNFDTSNFYVSFDP